MSVAAVVKEYHDHTTVSGAVEEAFTVGVVGVAITVHTRMTSDTEMRAAVLGQGDNGRPQSPVEHRRGAARGGDTMQGPRGVGGWRGAFGRLTTAPNGDISNGTSSRLVHSKVQRAPLVA